jgi:hypothetical protein
VKTADVDRLVNNLWAMVAFVTVTWLPTAIFIAWAVDDPHRPNSDERRAAPEQISRDGISWGGVTVNAGAQTKWLDRSCRLVDLDCLDELNRREADK